MRVDLIHGGVWDGWWIMADENGRRRIVRDLLDCEFVGIRATCTLEDVTDRCLPRSGHRPRPAIDRELSTAHLTLIEGDE